MGKRKTNSDLVYVVCVCLRIMVSNTYCVVFCFFFLRLIYIMLPISLHCPFLNALSVFSRVYYLQNTVENLRIEQDESHWKLGVNSVALEGQEVPNPLFNTRYLNRPMICWIFNVIGEQGCFCFVEECFDLVKYLSISAKNWLF
jgi:hypothetical protein